MKAPSRSARGKPDDPEVRIGIDLGGTKIAVIAMTARGTPLFTARRPTPREDYDGVIAAIAALVAEAEAALSLPPGQAPVGIGMPGSVSPVTGLVQNANSTWLNAKPFHADLERALGRPLRLANDANCLALSEATDGTAAGARSVFAVILGTGCGGGLVAGGRIIAGRNMAGGEWGHNPLPWMTAEEYPGPACWCGRRGCMETWVSGPALERDYLHAAGADISGEEIARRAIRGEGAARAALERHANRLARGLAHVVNVFDPEVIVIGGGLHALPGLYEALPGLMAPWVFADAPRLDIRPAAHGAASGVRGAARLWDITDDDWTF